MQKKKKLRVAVIQDSPVIMDKEKTLVKVEKLADRASREGAELILFPEAFITLLVNEQPGNNTARKANSQEVQQT